MNTFPDPLVLSFTFMPGEEPMVEVTYSEHREQTEFAGVVKTASSFVGASEEIRDLTYEILDSGQELVDAILLAIRNPPSAKPSRTMGANDDDD